MKAGRKVTLSMVAMLLVAAAASRAEGAAAQARATAEVIDAADIDFHKAISGAAEEKATPSSGRNNTAPQPQVKKVVVDGVIFITIDYN